jgi:hypothetical protein
MLQRQFVDFVLGYIQKHGDSVDSHVASTFISQLREEDVRKASIAAEVSGTTIGASVGVLATNDAQECRASSAEGATLND